MIAPIFDRALLRARRERAAPGFADFDFLRAEAVARLTERLGDFTRLFPLTLEWGAADDRLRSALLADGRAETVLLCDSAPALAAGLPHPAAAADLDAPPLRAGALDAVFSLCALQWIDDLPGALIQLRGALKPDGLFLAALIGGETLHELRSAAMQAEIELYGGASPRVAPMVGLADAAALLQRAGFALPVADSDTVMVDYADAFALMRDLRGFGATNMLVDRPRRPVGRAFFIRMAALYAERFARPDGRIAATFELIWMTGWAPAAGQQQPLRPGAATARLADALGSEERCAGETARGG